jgi:hypothetical protein
MMEHAAEHHGGQDGVAAERSIPTAKGENHVKIIELRSQRRPTTCQTKNALRCFL